MQKNEIIPNITIDKLILWGTGLATDPTTGKRIIISGGAIPWSIVDIRVVKNRSNRIEGQILNVVKKSPLEASLPEHFQVYGGCRWLPIPYEEQVKIKEQQIREVFHHVPELTKDTTWHPIQVSPEIYGYRNKVEFSWGKYISGREWIHEEYRFGFHAAGQFDRIIDCSYCALGDEVTNTLFHIFDQFARESRLPTYDTKIYQGFWRHLVIRRAKKTDETMVILSVNTDFLGEKTDSVVEDFRVALKSLVDVFKEKHIIVDSFYLLHNSGRADIVQGDYELISWNPIITEKLFDLTFEISPRSFFQTNTLGAEVLYRTTQDMIHTQDPIIFDLYAGTGTIGMIVANRAEKVYSVEIVPSASEDNIRNLEKNGLTNVEVVNAPVENFLKDWRWESDSNNHSHRKESMIIIPEQSTMNNQRWTNPDVIIIDPPRAGMHPDAPEIIKNFSPQEIIYVSCNPATLARDLVIMCGTNEYRLTDITPVDMFPHTHHIETVVRLEKK